jgi:hypothetical protein
LAPKPAPARRKFKVGILVNPSLFNCYTYPARLFCHGLLTCFC